jgi:hypothetical protein
MLNVFGREESSEGGSNLGVNPKSRQKVRSWSLVETTCQIGEGTSRSDSTGGQSGVLSGRTYSLD